MNAQNKCIRVGKLMLVYFHRLCYITDVFPVKKNNSLEFGIYNHD